jgi:cation:H+ antiporter
MLELLAGLLLIALASKVAENTVNHALRIASLLNISHVMLGILIVSISTSLPELLVTIFSTPAMAGANLFGSVAVNIGLILAIFGVRGADVDANSMEVIRISCLLTILSSTTAFLLQSPLVAPFLFLSFALYVKYVKKYFSPPSFSYFLHSLELAKNVCLFLITLFLTISISKVGIDLIVDFVKKNGIDQGVIGASVIAIETSIPELIVAITALRKGVINLSLGDIAGSNVVNTTLIYSLLLIKSACIISRDILYFSIAFPLILYITIEKGRLDRSDSAILFMLFALYLFSLWRG